MFDKAKHLNRRYLLYTRRYATLAAALAVITLGLIGLVLYPQVQSVLELISDSQKTRKTVQTLEAKVASLQSLPQSELLQSEYEINSVLPSKKPLLELLTGLNQVAVSSQIRFTEVTLSPGLVASNSAELEARQRSIRSKGDFEELALEMKIEGSLDDIQLFLNQIETVSPVTTVTSMKLAELTFRSENTEDDEKLFQATLSTVTYFFTQQVTSTLSAPVDTLAADQAAALEEVNTFLIPRVTEQTEITGGGLQDLFGVAEQEFLTQEELDI